MDITQIPSPNHYDGRGGFDIAQIMIHDMEAPEKGTTAEAVARYFQRASVRASAHLNIDNNSIVQSVAFADGAWACPFYNRSAIHLEHAGYARQSRHQWSDEYSTAMLDRSAREAARLAHEFDIPVRWLTRAQVRQGTARGFLTHWDATKAGVGGNTHTDPGPGFPRDRYLDRVRHYLDHPHEDPAPDPAPGRPVLTLGDTGPAVADLQRFLLRVFPSYAGPIRRSGGVDGSYGPATASVVREFQARAQAAGMYADTVDGVCGPHTWAALAHYGYGK